MEVHGSSFKTDPWQKKTFCQPVTQVSYLDSLIFNAGVQGQKLHLFWVITTWITTRFLWNKIRSNSDLQKSTVCTRHFLHVLDVHFMSFYNIAKPTNPMVGTCWHCSLQGPQQCHSCCWACTIHQENDENATGFNSVSYCKSVCPEKRGHGVFFGFTVTNLTYLSLKIMTWHNRKGRKGWVNWGPSVSLAPSKSSNSPCPSPTAPGFVQPLFVLRVTVKPRVFFQVKREFLETVGNCCIHFGLLMASCFKLLEHESKLPHLPEVGSSKSPTAWSRSRASRLRAKWLSPARW